MISDIIYARKSKQTGKFYFVIEKSLLAGCYEVRIPVVNQIPCEISKVIFNPPATIVIWSDKTKTVVKCGEKEPFDPEKGLAMAICKKVFNNRGNYYNIFKKWLPCQNESIPYNNLKENGIFPFEDFITTLAKVFSEQSSQKGGADK